MGSLTKFIQIITLLKYIQHYLKMIKTVQVIVSNDVDVLNCCNCVKNFMPELIINKSVYTWNKDRKKSFMSYLLRNPNAMDLNL